MLNRPLSAHDIMDRLCGLFVPIHARWQDAVPNQSPIWEETQGMSALGILERDIKHIGRYFADADELGARSEYALLAECVAHIRTQDSALPSNAILESKIDKALAEIEAENLNALDTFEAPLSWRLTRVLKAQLKSFPSDSAVQALDDVFHDIANLFLLRDGNITPEEDEKLKEYNATFNG